MSEPLHCGFVASAPLVLDVVAGNALAGPFGHAVEADADLVVVRPGEVVRLGDRPLQSVRDVDDPRTDVEMKVPVHDVSLRERTRPDFILLWIPGQARNDKKGAGE